jgi:hypothetical protein
MSAKKTKASAEHDVKSVLARLKRHSSRIERHKIFMLTRKGKLRRWNPNLTSTEGVLGVWALCAGSGNVYAGGDFTAVHGANQQRLAIFKHV